MKQENLFSRTVFSIAISLSLAACGGGEAIDSGGGASAKTSAASSKKRPAPAPTTTTNPSWIQCAYENGVCTFTGTRQVQYGANNIYAYVTATDSVGCNNTVFGDPVPGVAKSCQYSSTTTVAPSTSTTTTTTTTTTTPTTTTPTTSVAPAGFVPIVIDAPVNASGATLSVASYGASTSSADNTTAFRNAIAAAKTMKAAKLIVPTGVYYFDADQQRVMFDGLTDFVFDGQNSEFIFRKKGFFGFSNNTRTVFKNFVVDWDWDRSGPIAYMAKVVKVDYNAQTIELNFPKVADMPTSIQMFNVEMIDADTCKPTIRGTEVWNASITSMTKTGANTLVVKTPTSSILNLPVGASLRIRQYNYDWHAMTVDNVKHTTFDNINLYASTGMGWVNYNSDHFELINSKVTIRPGSGRCISAAADAFHVGGSHGFFRLENNEFAYQGDDGMNIKDPATVGVDRIDNRTLLIKNAPWWRMTFGAGDIIELRNPDYTPLSMLPAVATATYQDPNSYRITFTADLPAVIDPNAIVFNRTRYNTVNYSIRNNYLHSNRARGILAKGSLGWIDGNRIERTSLAAMQIEVGGDEGTMIDGLTVSNNTFTSNDAYGWSFGTVAVYGGSGDPVYRPIRNLSIIGNTFNDTADAPVDMYGVDTAFVKGNTVTSGTMPKRFDLKSGQFRVGKSNKVNYCSNVVDPLYSLASPYLYTDTATTSNISTVCTQ
jgi:hypothetical protein